MATPKGKAPENMETKKQKAQEKKMGYPTYTPKGERTKVKK